MATITLLCHFCSFGYQGFAPFGINVRLSESQDTTASWALLTDDAYPSLFCVWFKA